MELSVLVPTHGRPRVLARCLDHLAAQVDAPPFEVIVSVDGDDDYAAAELDRRAAEFPIPLRVTREAHQGQAAALNRALSLAQGRLVLVIGDDILGEERWVARHVERHALLDDPWVAVQGKVSWHPELFPDPFLEWEARAGLLFAFQHAEENAFVPARFLYTCNVSFHRETLTALGGFHENLPCWIDTVFAFHAEKKGLKLFYDPAASAWHLDRWTLSRVCRRRREKGRLSVGVTAADPDFASFVTMPQPGPWRSLRYGVSRLVRPLAERAGWRRLTGWCWIHEANHHFTVGVRAGHRELAGESDRVDNDPFHGPDLEEPAPGHEQRGARG